MGSDLLVTLMHLDDLARASVHLSQLQQAQDDEVLEFEYRMRHANGIWCWLWTREVIFQRQVDGTPQQIQSSL